MTEAQRDGRAAGKLKRLSFKSTNGSVTITPTAVAQRAEVDIQVALATLAEVTAGTNAVKPVTPSTLNSRLSQGTVSPITTPDATDLDTVITLTNANKAKLNEIINKLTTIIFK